MQVNRRTALRAGAAGLASLSGCVVGSREGPAFDESFENGLDGWRTDAAIGPEVDLDEFDWAIDATTDRAHTGGRSVAVFTEGDHDDGVAWLTRRVDTAALDADRLRVSAWLWSESESFNTLRNAVLRVGPDPPAAEADFPAPETVSAGATPTTTAGLRQSLHRVEGWDRYAFEWRPATLPDEVYLSVGVAVVWEADATHYVDDVRVEAVE
ncbi:hypothetical protein [Halobaculum lipolyticum]|uniref:Tat (Twin-arginine translocation) pathway signal sequence n=1 Tax=Halobaculum lipolyticum TaxID=3032001 RepID=A0ABD5WGU4_9EURY|nr:hypothetical protein [Halobaculum sp. DT31]